jgi:signal transduction histidine kinase
MTGPANGIRLLAYSRPFTACLRVLISLGLVSALPLGALGKSKTVLTIYSDDHLLPANQALDEALRDRLSVETHDAPTCLSEFLDFSRFGNSAYDKLASNFLRSKYAGQPPDVVIAVGPLAFQFLYRHQDDLFTGIPLIVLGVRHEPLQAQTLPPNFVEVPVAVEPLPTFELALRLQPDAREIVVITGASEFDRSWEARLRNDLPHLQTSVPIRYLSGLALDDLLRELSGLTPKAIVYVASFFRDGAGGVYVPSRALRRMADVSAAPMYGSYSTFVGAGIVGGYVLRFEDVSRQAADLVKRILDGEKLAQAVVSPTVPPKYLVDWTQLQRWHLSEDRLPPGSIVLYRELNAWQHYKQYIIGAIFVVLAETLLIFGLLWQRARRRKVEEALRASEERLGLAVQAGRMYAFEWDSATDVIVRTDQCESILNWMDDPTRVSGRQFIAGIHPDDREAYDVLLAGLAPENPVYQTSYRVLRPDGSVVWLEANGSAIFDARGRRLRIIGLVADITERKLAEEALSSVSRRLIEAQEQERGRIARELHDDLSQRMALLQIGLEQFEQATGGLSSQARQQLDKITEVTSEVSSGIHNLSHRLHPSKLDTLGLVASLGGLCREFSEQHRLHVDFVHHHATGHIPQDVTLCLFRITQEALQNVVKHSGATEAQVDLSGHGDGIDLCISDSGTGFSPESATEDAGLGLISMRERLRLVEGHLAVESEPSHGTRIRVRVPFLAANAGVSNERKAHKAGA